MGVQYIGVCRSCRKKIDLDKFYIDSWIGEVTAWSVRTNGPIEIPELEERLRTWGLWSARWVAFTLRHPGHPLEIINQNRDGDEAWDFAEELEFRFHCLEPFVVPEKRPTEPPA